MPPHLLVLLPLLSLLVSSVSLVECQQKQQTFNCEVCQLESLSEFLRTEQTRIESERVDDDSALVESLKRLRDEGETAAAKFEKCVERWMSVNSRCLTACSCSPPSMCCRNESIPSLTQTLELLNKLGRLSLAEYETPDNPEFDYEASMSSSGLYATDFLEMIKSLGEDLSKFYPSARVFKNLHEKQMLYSEPKKKLVNGMNLTITKLASSSEKCAEKMLLMQCSTLTSLQLLMMEQMEVMLNSGIKSRKLAKLRQEFRQFVEKIVTGAENCAKNNLKVGGLSLSSTRNVIVFTVILMPVLVIALCLCVAFLLAKVGGYKTKDAEQRDEMFPSYRDYGEDWHQADVTEFLTQPKDERDFTENDDVIEPAITTMPDTMPITPMIHEAGEVDEVHV